MSAVRVISFLLFTACAGALDEYQDQSESIRRVELRLGCARLQIRCGARHDATVFAHAGQRARTRAACRNRRVTLLPNGFILEAAVSSALKTVVANS
jgi:hypothetical protein